MRRGTDGRVSRAVLPDGRVSKLFDALASIPVMENRERAASFFKKCFTSRFKRDFGDWTKGVPRNPRAWKKIRERVEGLPAATRRAVLQYAAGLDNPIMIRKANPGYEDNLLGQSYYTEEDGEGEWYIMDAMSNGEYDMGREVPSDRSEREYAPAFLSLQPSPVNKFATKGGDTYWVASRGILAREVSSLRDEPVDGLLYDTGEPRLFFFTSDGMVFDDYGEALSHSSGTTIRAGFIRGSAAGMLSDVPGAATPAGARIASEEGVVSIMEIPASCNPVTRNGLINYFIKKGFLSGRRERDPRTGSYKLVGAGGTLAQRAFSSAVAFGNLLQRVRPGDVSMDGDGRITLRNFDNSRIPVWGHDGRRSTMSRDELKEMVRSGRYGELKERYDFLDPLLVSLLYGDNTSGAYQGRDDGADMRRRNEIVGILRTFGIRVMGMSDYLEKYAIKNGVEPDARALADIANGVIALAEDAGVEDLQEEVAHFLVEAYSDQAAVSEAMEGVRETAEWDRYASSYYEAYGREFSGRELDRAVEREILGKVLAGSFREQAVTPLDTGFLARVKGLLSSMKGFFRSKLGGQRNDLDRVIRDIREAAASGRVSAFDTSQLKGNPYTLYSLGERANRRFLDSKVADLRRSLNSLRRIYADRSDSAAGMTAAGRISLERLRMLERDISAAEGDVEGADMLRALSSLVNTAEAMSAYIKGLMPGEGGTGGGEAMSPSGRVAVDVLYGEVLPMLNDIRGFISRNAKRDDAGGKGVVDKVAGESLRKRAGEIIADINAFRAEVDSNFSNDQASLMTRLMDKFGVPEEDRAKIMDMVNAVQRDISIFSRWFGILEHSGNIIDGALGRLIAENYYNAMGRTQDDVRQFLREVQRGKWDRAKFESLIKKYGNGKHSRWLLGPVDMARYERDLKIEHVKALRDILKDSDFARMSDKEIEDFVDSGRPRHFKVSSSDDDGRVRARTVRYKPTIDRNGIPFLNIADDLAFKDRIRRWKEENDEDMYTPEYRRELDSIKASAERKLGRALHPESLSLLRSISRQKFLLKYDQAFYDNGVYHPERFFSSPNAGQYRRLDAELREAASPEYSVGGTVMRKTGVELERSQDIAAVMEARREFYSKHRQRRNVSESIYDTVRRIQMEGDARAAFDFLVQSGRFSFSEKFYRDAGFGDGEASGGLEGLADELRRKGASREVVEESRRLAKEVHDARVTMRGILAKYRDSFNLGNILVDEMTEYDMDVYRHQSELVAGHMRLLRERAEHYGVDMPAVAEGGASESGMTDDYFRHVNALEGKNRAQAEYEFIMSHMPESRKGFLKAFLRKIQNRNGQGFSAMERDFLAQELGIEPGLESNDFNERFDAVKKQLDGRFDVYGLASRFGRNFVYGYFRRFAPVGYSRFVERVSSGASLDMADFARAVMSGRGGMRYGFDLSYLEYTPDSMWAEEELSGEGKYNPGYARDMEYGTHHPRMDKYRDDEYFRRFGIGADGRATRNLSEWNMLEMMKEINRKAYAAYGITDRSIYAIPQVSQHTLERVGDVASGQYASSVKNWMRDTFTDTVDDSLYGVTDYNEQPDTVGRTRALPRYYINELEDADNISHDLAYSFGLLAESANLYKEKAESYSLAVGLEQILLRQQFAGGKKAEATNAYAMFKNFMDNYYYGIRGGTQRLTFNIMGFEVDFTKIAFALERFWSTMNLAFSPAVAATGAVTGNMTFALEGAVGQYIDRDSLTYAYKEFGRKAGSYISEIGDLDRKSKIYVLGERLGVFSFRNRLYGAGYNKAARVLTRDVCYKLLEAATANLGPTVMIGVLDGARYYKPEGGEGRFYTKRQLYAQLESEGRAGEFKSVWEGLRGRSLYNMVDVKDGEIVPVEGSGVKLDEIMAGLSMQRNKIRSLGNIVDGTLNEEQQTAARRNFLLRFLTSHRGWMSLAGQRVFKRHGYNFMTNQFEEGLMSTIGSYVANVIRNGREQGFTGLVSALRTAYGELSPEAKVNMARMAAHMAFWGFGVVLAQAMLGLAGGDDGKDDWASQFAAYIAMRSINEVSSMMAVPYMATLVDTVNDPFVNARNLQDMLVPSNYSLERVTSGAYKGETKLFRTLAKQTFLKQWYTYKTAEDVHRAMEWWRQTNSHVMWMYGAGR